MGGAPVRVPDGATAIARRLVHNLIDYGVRDAVLCPGSRSGPLAMALAAADFAGALRLHVRIDEREAGFLALGLAKGSHRVVPVITTSGTAVANLHPALLEAKHSGVPLLAVTADRPTRLRETGANQTTEQREIFPGIPFTDRVSEILGALRTDSPLHLNVELDQPLLEPIDWGFTPSSQPAWTMAMPLSDRADVPCLTIGPRTVVVAGDDAKQPARHMARDAHWPLLAEPSSGSRNGQNALIAYRLLLEHSPLASRIERVVSFGHATLSRPISILLARTDIEIIHVGDQSTFPLPAGPNVRFVEAVAVDGAAVDTDDGGSWLAAWKAADSAAVTAIDKVLDGSTPYDVARTVSDAVPPNGLLFVGSSNPIRDLDLVARPYTVGQRRYVIANRGLAGIDGVLSSAIGASLARNSSRALLYVGDLTFLHGSNGLLIGPNEPRPDLTIVVASDDGGSIFATLEQGASEYADSFERIYATPTGASIGDLCRGYGVEHQIVEPADLAEAIKTPAVGIRVLEVPLDRHGRRELGKRISSAVRDAVADILP